MIEWAKGTPVTLVDYGEDDELAILHAVPTAEGAIRTAIEHTEDTLLGMNVLCFGLGRVGLSVADAFRSMKSKVSLGCAQSRATRARLDARLRSNPFARIGAMIFSGSRCSFLLRPGASSPVRLSRRPAAML